MERLKKSPIIVLTLWSIVFITIAVLVFYHDYLNKPRSLDEILERGTINVVCSNSFYEYNQQDSLYPGFNYELIKKVTDSLNLKVDIKTENNYNRIIRGLNSGKYDLCISTLPINSMSLEELSFLDPINKTTLHLLQLKKPKKELEHIKDILQLEGKKITILNQSPYQLTLDNIRTEIGIYFSISKLSNTDADEAIEMLNSGEIDYLVLERHLAKHYAEINSNINIRMRLGFNHFYSWSVDKRNKKLADNLNSILQNIKKTDDYNELLRKYY